ncbi:MAG: glycosyltransferase family 2 protein, partial [Methanomassiliicoccus sp.]
VNDDIIVLIPAYREELTIASMVLLAKGYASRVIVVDDGSPDRTREVAAMAGAEVISHEANKGKAAALMTGLTRCRELSPKCVVMIDGDGQMDPALIPVVAAPVMNGVADLVIGSRFIGNEVTDTPQHRRVGQKVLNKATNIGSTIRVSDSQSGYRALSLKAINNMDFDSDNYNIESDMITHFSDLGLSIIEVPVTVRYDVPDGHKQKPFKHGMSVLGRAVTYIGYRKPLLLFGIPGSISFVLGLIVCVATFMEIRVLFDWTLVSQGIAGIVSLGVGIFLLFAALMLNSMSLLMRNVERSIRQGR